MTAGVAVVVTCRDLGRFLEEALRSVEHQTHPASEVVVVDDDSHDVYTRQVLQRIADAGVTVAHMPKGNATGGAMPPTPSCS